MKATCLSLSLLFCFFQPTLQADASWQCGIEGHCYMCPSEEHECSSGVPTFNSPQQCLLDSPCHIAGPPGERWQCLSESGICQSCKHHPGDHESCKKGFKRFFTEEDCSRMTQCQTTVDDTGYQCHHGSGKCHACTHRVPSFTETVNPASEYAPAPQPLVEAGRVPAQNQGVSQTSEYSSQTQSGNAYMSDASYGNAHTGLFDNNPDAIALQREQMFREIQGAQLDNHHRLIQESIREQQAALRRPYSSQQSQGYGTQIEGYGNQDQGHGTPSQGYGRQSHGTQSQGYGTQSQGYGTQGQAHGTTSQGYGMQSHGTQSQGYGTQSQGYGTQGQAHGTPSQGYGMQSQGYGTQGQAHGTPSQGYGMQSQGYGMQGQAHGTPSQGYGMQSHGTQNQGYGTQSQGYGTQGQAHGTQSQGYGMQSQGYGRQGQAHGTPSPGYGMQSQGYGTQGQAHGTRSQGYGIQSHGTQSQGYGTQGQTHGTPNQGYGMQSYGTQSQGYGTQSQGYGTQSQGYGTQSQGYGKQSQGYGTQSQGYGSGQLVMKLIIPSDGYQRRQIKKIVRTAGKKLNENPHSHYPDLPDPAPYIGAAAPKQQLYWGPLAPPEPHKPTYGDTVVIHNKINPYHPKHPFAGYFVDGGQFGALPGVILDNGEFLPVHPLYDPDREPIDPEDPQARYQCVQEGQQCRICKVGDEDDDSGTCEEGTRKFKKRKSCEKQTKCKPAEARVRRSTFADFMPPNVGSMGYGRMKELSQCDPWDVVHPSKEVCQSKCHRTSTFPPETNSFPDTGYRQ